MANYNFAAASFPAQGIVALSSGTEVHAQRAVLIDCTGSGNVTLQFNDDTTLTLNVQANSVYQFNWGIKKFTNGTATVAVYNLL